MRRSGRTTRMIDEAIQELFTSHKVIIRDHYETKHASFELLKRFKRRLEYEHNMTYGDYVVVSKGVGFEVILKS